MKSYSKNKCLNYVTYQTFTKIITNKCNGEAWWDYCECYGEEKTQYLVQLIRFFDCGGVLEKEAEGATIY